MSGFTAQASTTAAQTDTLFLALVILAALFVVGVFGTIIYFSIKYRRGSSADRANPPTANPRLEFGFISLLVVLALGAFIWAGSLYFNIVNPPSQTMNIYVIGKQWMWQFQHPEGRLENSELHVPVNQPVKLTMISQDVIHSFFVPAFRVKQDVLPGQYTELWFEATQTGQYHLECSQYCGTDHSLMGGIVIVMAADDYRNWLAGVASSQSSTVSPSSSTSSVSSSTGSQNNLVSEGADLFQAFGCSSCHLSNGQGAGPSLVGIYGRSTALDSGATVMVDDGYLRESILYPNRKIVAGYKPIMPTFDGQITEDETIALIAYVKSLSLGEEAAN